jgi:hypothetical protein
MPRLRAQPAEGPCRRARPANTARHATRIRCAALCKERLIVQRSGKWVVPMSPGLDLAKCPRTRFAEVEPRLRQAYRLRGLCFEIFSRMTVASEARPIPITMGDRVGRPRRTFTKRLGSCLEPWEAKAANRVQFDSVLRFRPTSNSSLSSSLWMRGTPQNRLSVLIRWISDFERQ